MYVALLSGTDLGADKFLVRSLGTGVVDRFVFCLMFEDNKNPVVAMTAFLVVIGSLVFDFFRKVSTGGKMNELCCVVVCELAVAVLVVQLSAFTVMFASSNLYMSTQSIGLSSKLSSLN